ncbi:MAG: alternative ribosome rescue aminoacyl-tRNA hydrolase ArfB [Spirosomataceae bacterium]
MPQQLPDFSSELRITTSRSSGAGGQHVNKVETKVEIRWNVTASFWFTDEEKIKIQKFARGYLTTDTEIILVCQETRSQLQNKRLGIQRLRHLVRQALQPVVERKPTTPTKSSIVARLKTKKHAGEKKAFRQKGRAFWEQLDD